MSLFTGFDLFAEALDSMKTMSWSPSPGKVVQRDMSVGLLVRKISRMFSFLVGWVTIWWRLQDSTRSRIKVFIRFVFWLPSTVLEVQLMSGRFRSPAIHITAFL